MADAGDQDHREELDDEYRFLRWVQDPEGRLFCVEGVKTFGASGPVFLSAPGSPLVQRLLKVVNNGLGRVQSVSRSHEGFDIEISQVVGRRKQLVFEESCDVTAEGRRRARTLVSQIEDGTFRP